MFSSGVDPKVVQFQYTTTSRESDWKMWVRTKIWYQHTHDVRAMAVTPTDVVSLIAIVYSISWWAWLRTEMPSCCSTLTTWSYGDWETPGKPEEIPPQKLIQLKTKDGQHIACSAISSRANWMSYSDIDGVKHQLISGR